jgi:hypothetical protein
MQALFCRIVVRVGKATLPTRLLGPIDLVLS